MLLKKKKNQYHSRKCTALVFYINLLRSIMEFLIFRRENKRKSIVLFPWSVTRRTQQAGLKKTSLHKYIKIQSLSSIENSIGYRDGSVTVFPKPRLNESFVQTTDALHGVSSTFHLRAFPLPLNVKQRD